MNRYLLILVTLAPLLAVLSSACSDRQSQIVPVVMIGIDGAEWNVINDMLADGELPNLARIKKEGAWGYLLNPGPAVSPVVWTTIATGHFGRQHGILAHTYPYIEGNRKRPVSSELRQEPALWNIASHYGLRSVVVGYFVTHPAEDIDGVIVSPRVYHKLEGALSPVDALDLEQPHYAELKEKQVKKDLWSRFLGWEFDLDQQHDPQSPYQRAAAIIQERNIHKRVIEDEYQHRAAMELAGNRSDLFISYYRLIDFMSHSLWVYYDDSEFATPADPDGQLLFGNSVKESYRFVDEAIGDLLARWDGQANFMIVSDHGFGSSLKMEKGIDTRSSHLTGDHRPNGIMLAIGPDIEPGEIKGMTIMEVAPTLVALLDIPLSGELPGRVAIELLSADFRAGAPIRSVTNYDNIRVNRRDVNIDREGEEQDMSNLRGLGYIGEGIELADAAEGGEYDFWTSDARIVISIMVSEVLYYLLQGDPVAAEASVDLLSVHRPDLSQNLIRRTRQKYLTMLDQLPVGYLDPTPFERFFDRHLDTDIEEQLLVN